LNRLADTNLGFITLGKGICNKCKNVYDDGLTCRAFPGGIPEEILVGEFDHHKPYEGDRGIQFEPMVFEE